VSDSNVEVLVAIGRIEEMVKAMNDKLDRLESTTDRHWKKISELETEIALLKERQGPKVHWMTVIAIVASVSAIILGILDRIFVNQ